MCWHPGDGADPCHKLVDLLFECFHLDGLARMIESLARAGWGDARGLAQLLEDLDVGFHSIQGVSQWASR